MIDKLEMFICLAKEKHFGRAAEQCRVTQPTLSAGIKQLEDQLGVMLVRRGSRFVGLTPEGERVLERARKIVGDTRAMREEVRAAKGGLSGHVRIAVIPTALSMVSDLTEPFSGKHPNVTFSVFSCSSIEILSHLENLEIEAGITYLQNEPVGRATTVPLFVERYRFVTAEGNDLAHRQAVTWKEVSEQPLCLLTPDMQNRRIINQHLAEAGASASPTLESNSIITLYSHIRTGKWSGILPLKIVEAFGPHKDLKTIPITEPDASHLVGLIAAYREPHTPIISSLLAQAKRISQI